ncbi:MAG: glutamate--tRNA ligase [Spirochaeta sp. LUC14_002_19_P3]|nr:MAG: glutamate--tRNA ligase [Spirochaeta sp. LUC14_002_19_P3]
MSVRVRYAPSPTGLQHIGGIRTALFNYFFARANGGQFILRIEDTDQTRSTPEALEDLYSSLNWLGIDYDEGPGKDGGCGPYIQSERQALYREMADKLIGDGTAYRCFCRPERLEQLREQQKAEGVSIIGYDRNCRGLNPDEAASRAASGEAHVIRLKVPLEGKTEFTDILLGRTGRKNKDISPDPVILKADGFPTYHLANVIDDHLMGITHILRAQEWIPSGPLHVLLYRAFGWELPQYCHLPMVMGKDGQKLSKRHGATALSEFRRAGYLPEALINSITLLGWSYDDSREFFTKDDFSALFTLERINKSPAVFDYNKLDWFNGQYIRLKEPEALKAELMAILVKDGIAANPPSQKDYAILEGAFPVVRERLKTLTDVSPLTRFLYTDPGLGTIGDAIPKGMNNTEAAAILGTALELLAKAPPLPSTPDACVSWDKDREEEFRGTAAGLGCKLGALMQPLRLALTANKVSLPLFPAIRLLGMKESLARGRRLMDALKQA